MQRGDLIAGRYRLDTEAGSDGRGEAWHAVEQRTNAAVLLRQVSQAHLGPGDRERARARLRVEAVAVSQLHHPHIVSVRELVVHDDEPWLVMDDVPAPSLAELTAEEPLPPRRAARIGEQAASALGHAHSARPGVVHGALAPRSLLIRAGDDVALTGFGIPGMEGSDQQGADAGTPAEEAGYLAPEVAKGRPGGPAADVFSLGATLYAAVEGHPPWETLAAARKGVVDPPQRAEALGPVLTRMMESEPHERPTASAAARMLAEVAHGSAGTSGRRRIWTAVAVVAAAAVVAAGLVVWLQRPPTAAVGPAAAPAAAGPSLGEPATADPCSLIPPEPLDRFGGTTVEADSGNFDRCDVVIDSGQDRSTVQLQFARSDPTPPSQPEQRDGVVIVRDPPTPDGECTRTLRLPDGYETRIVARPVRGPLPDPCAVADAATDSALALLAAGPVPRRTAPFAPGSLATVDACGLLDTPTVATVPTLEKAKPEPDVAGWTCDWENLTTTASIEVSYDRNRGGLGREAGDRVRIAGRDAAARRDADGAGCDVQVMHRPYTDKRGYPSAELLSVKVDEAVPVADPCARGIAIAEVAAGRLPAPTP